jgi:hypothetical protein
MYPMSMTALFESVGLFYGVFLPLGVFALFTIFTLPAAFRQTASADAVCFAAYCYLGQMLGVLLMTAGGLPALYAVFAMQPLSEMTYLGLLLVFAIGGLLFLWNDNHLRTIDPAARTVPGSVFFATWKFIGLLVTVFASLSFVLKLMLVVQLDPRWWVPHMIMLLYGLILSWFTLHRAKAGVRTPSHAPARTLIASKPKGRVKKG